MSIAPILQLGDDALASQFQLTFPAGIPGGAGAGGDIVALRIDQPVDVPMESVGEYEYYYKGIKITKTNMTDETDKHLDVQVRLDQQWAVFDAIKAWKDIVHNPRNGTRLAWALINAPILLEALDGSGAVVKRIKIANAVLKSFKITSFEAGSTDPSRLELQFVFSSLDYE